MENIIHNSSIPQCVLPTEPVKTSRKVVLDIEADSLTPTRIWCVVVKDIDTNEVFVFDDQGSSPGDLRTFLDSVDVVIGHNVLDYDLPVLGLLWDVVITPDRVLDTLVLSRLLHAKREGGHSLESWGERLRFPKGDFSDFSKYSSEMLEYCKQDVELNHKVYLALKKVLDRNPGVFDKALKVEQEMAVICREMRENGFRYDIEEATKIEAELVARVAELDKKIEQSFPPKTRLVKEQTPKATKHGTISRVGFQWYAGTDFTQFTVGEPFSVFEYYPFNAGSPKQVVERLWEAGWKPVEKTKTHIQAEKERKVTEDHKYYGWKISEANLATLPADAPEGARLLVERILLAARIRTLNEWKEAYSADTGSIHGRFHHIGTGTHRMSHSNPNMGNVATKKSIKYNTPHLRALALDYGGRMRSLWGCSDGTHLVGCDMEGAHLRIFAHLIKDEQFIKALVEGKKEDGTDIHSLNKRNLGDICVDRDRAKTFIFSFLNGAAAPKIAEVFSCSQREAKQALDRYVQAYPGLKDLKQYRIPRDAGRGYFIGLDGRKVICDSEHLMMGMYLQNGEAVIMKHAIVQARAEIKELGIQAKLVNVVHDEAVWEVTGAREEAEMVGSIQAEAIKQTGEKFNVCCPLAGEYKVGGNWLDVH